MTGLGSSSRVSLYFYLFMDLIRTEKMEDEKKETRHEIK